MVSLYNPASIQKRTLCEAIRTRPGMYIGSTDLRGLHHMVYYLVDSSLEEVIAGATNHIDIVIHPDGAVMVRDNGCGIPVDIDHETQKPLLELAMTDRIKVRRSSPDDHKTYFDWSGVGRVVVNALSEWMRVEVRQDDQIYAQEYRAGMPSGPLMVAGVDPGGRGTTINFRADLTVFAMVDYDYDILAERFRELCYLLHGLKIIFIDQRRGRECENSFYFENGSQTWVRDLNKEHTVLHEPFYAEGMFGQTRIAIAMQYNDSSTELIRTFVNSEETDQGGTHLLGFRMAVTHALNEHAHKNDMLKTDEVNLTSADVSMGLTAIVSVMVLNPVYVHATKSRLGNAEVRDQVQQVVSPALRQFLTEHPQDAEKIIQHCLQARAARLERRAARRARKASIERT